MGNLYERTLLNRNDEHLERRINRKAAEYARTRDDPLNKARALTLRLDVVALANSYFFVVGDGITTDVNPVLDDFFWDTMSYCLERFDPSKAVFTHFVRFKYKRQIKSEAKREAERLKELEGEEWVVAAIAKTYAPVQESLRMAKANAAIAEFLSLVIGFLDHAPDRAHSERAKLYMKMNFTEWSTYAIKTQPTFMDCDPFVREEGRIFATIENGFLNVYMSAPCHTVHELWDTELKEGYGEILTIDDARLKEKRPPAPWKLAISVHIDYLKELGINVTPAVISQQRKRFDGLKEQFVIHV